MSKLIAKIKSFVRANEHEMDYLMSLCEKDSDVVSPSISMLLFSWNLHKHREFSSSNNNSAQTNGVSRLSKDADKRSRFCRSSDSERLNRSDEYFLEVASN